MSGTRGKTSSSSWLPAYLILGFVWGCSFIFIKLGLEFLTPFGVAFVRCALGALTLLLIAKWRGYSLPKDPMVRFHLWVVAVLLNVIPGIFYAWAETVVTSVLAGIINVANPHQKIIGIPVLKNEGSIDAEINALLEDKHSPYTLLHQFHQRGYAKTNPLMLDFMNRLWDAEKIPTDIVYTSKLLLGVEQLIKDNYFEKDASILVIHSGGLQGNRSLPEGTLKF